MRIRTTFWLLVAVLFAGALHLFMLFRDHAAGAAARPGALLMTLDPDAVDYLDVATRGWRVICRKEAGAWRLVEPMTGPGNAAVADRIVGEMALAQAESVLTPAQMASRGLTPASFGLDAPRARIQCAAGAAPPVVLLLGSETPFGGSLFARRADGPDVFAVRTNLLAALPAEPSGFRDPRLLEGAAAGVTRIELERREGGFVSFVRQADVWRIVQPFEDRADETRIRNLLDALFAAEAEVVVDAPHADPAVYGLSPETRFASLSLWRQDEREAAVRLDLGLATEQGQVRAYSQLGKGGAILLVSTGLLERLAFKAPEFRDRYRVRVDPDAAVEFRIRSGDRRLTAVRSEPAAWRLIEPVQARADLERIRAFLTGLPAMAAVAFEEAAPADAGTAPLGEVEVYAAVPPTGAVERVARLRILSRAPTDDRYRADTGTGVVFHLSGPAVRHLFGEEPFWEPLRFRDRAMLTLSAGAIKRIAVVRNAAVQTVERDEKGVWISHDGRQVNRDAVESLLGAVSALRAVRLEPALPDRMAAYGLEPPAVRVELGLAGTGGIQKNLIFGGADGAGNRYVQVQGEEPVFVVAPELAILLTHDLLQ